jgi:hypothetical protein
MSEGIAPPNRPPPPDMAGAEKDEELAWKIGALRSARPLGAGMEGAPKDCRGEGAGALKVGRESVRGAEKTGVGGGELKTELPRKVEGRVTWEA